MMAVSRKGDGTAVASDVELADSLVRMTIGLMFRRSIAPGYAMVFDMHREQYVSIHMMFVFFPIDLAYLDSEKRVVDIRHLKPWTGHACSRQPARYAIEMPSGAAEKASLQVGDVLEW